MITVDILLSAYRLMCAAKEMAATYENNRSICKYVHSTSRGHEAIQLATAAHLLPCDYVSPYYRDESLLLGLGFTPYQLMLQLLAKGEDIFTGGREYYSHPNYRGEDRPGIIHQSSATGMQVIPTTGIAQGIQYLEKIGSGLLRKGPQGEAPIVVCSLGDASITEGEVSEAFQFAVLKELPIIYLVQDNGWGISARHEETRRMDAYDYASGFKGMRRLRIDGTDFQDSYEAMGSVIQEMCVSAGVLTWYRPAFPSWDIIPAGLEKNFIATGKNCSCRRSRIRFPKLRARLLDLGLEEQQLARIGQEAAQDVAWWPRLLPRPSPRRNPIRPR